MADSIESASNNGLYFIVGGLVVVVGVIAYVSMGGYLPGTTDTTSITIEAPATPAPAAASTD